MSLGAFSVSLAVKDLKVSKTYYEKLGFRVISGELSQNYLIMKCGDHCIGLFQGMFEKNILTFNPGWDKDAKAESNFTDIRELLERIKENGIKISHDGVTSNTGPANFSIVDPDGNSILFDQHV